VRDFKKDERVVNLERNSNFIIAQFFDPLIFKGIHHHRIINLEPIIVDSEGGEIWTIASWRKRELCDFISAFERGHKTEVIWIGRKKIKDISIVSFQPPLTIRQRNAFELAAKEGYYSYPREVILKKLAALSGISFSTFHAHLRKAEAKLLPFLFRKSDNYR
jgi:predicted DNA binding protein